MKHFAFTRRFALNALIVAALACVVADASAQSGRRQTGQQQMQNKRKQNMQDHSKQDQGMQKNAMAGHQMAASDVKLGLNGYCPVCIVKQGKWVKGNDQHVSTYDGFSYRFPSNEVKQMFDQDPAQYVPALGGDCIVCYAKSGKRVPGDIRFASISDNRLFLFPSDNERKMFNKSPSDYIDVDLAADGKCIVCKVKAGKVVDGDQKFTAVHDGFRYLFPSDRERKIFVASSDEFIDANAAMLKESTMKKAGMMKSSSMIRIQGTTVCAGCEYGVTPINAPDELGLAVKTADGKIYVIEESHTRWPQLYKDRFDGKQVSVSGKVIKTQGNISWIAPADLRTL
jgi:YHS domain-containing protein